MFWSKNPADAQRQQGTSKAGSPWSNTRLIDMSESLRLGIHPANSEAHPPFSGCQKDSSPLTSSNASSQLNLHSPKPTEIPANVLQQPPSQVKAVLAGQQVLLHQQSKARHLLTKATVIARPLKSSHQWSFFSPKTPRSTHLTLCLTQG